MRRRRVAASASLLVGLAVPAGTEEITVMLPRDVPLVMVRIPAGTCTMGSPASERGRDPDEGPLHQVTLSRDCFLGKYEVTQRQWAAVMGANPSRVLGCGLDCPVEQVSWDDVCGGVSGSSCAPESFIGRLNACAGARSFRLPAEAEWERATRGETTSPFSFQAPVTVHHDRRIERLNAKGEVTRTSSQAKASEAVLDLNLDINAP